MKRSTVLYHINAETSDADIRASAEGAAAQDMHLGILLHDALPPLPINAYGAMPYGMPSISDDWGARVAEQQAALEVRSDRIGAILGDAGASGDVRPLLCADADIQSYVAQSARTADISVLAANLRDTPTTMRETLHSVLFRSPIGAVLNAHAGIAPRRMMIAWDDSDAAARAVHVALPLLKAADDVTVACFDPEARDNDQTGEPGAALSAWLSHHGCHVTIAQYPTGGREVSDCLTERAAELGIELLVLGGYGHSRMRQAVFGGTTRSMIEQTGLPVLLAH
ncbi:MAG: universal stress protein [Rhodobacteraceae bacterium]|nr:universal stress protein [Paracoccaceae bacterium]